MIYILCGDIETGKSTALLNWIKDRKDCYGIISPGNAPGERYFFDVTTRQEFRMEADPWEDGVIEVGRFLFLRSAFAKANAILKKATKNSEGTIIIDELGKLELKEEGLFDSAILVLETERNNKEIDLILVVRTSLLEQIILKYGIAQYSVISKQTLQELAADCNNGYTTKSWDDVSCKIKE